MSSATILLIEKNGSIKELTVKLSEFPNLYKKAGFTFVENFIEHYTWEVQTEDKKYSISVWGKKKGKNAKNAYQFPPPLEETNDFCGNVVLINHKGQQSLSIVEWNNIYDLLCEQVLHAAEPDEEEEEELEELEEEEDIEDDPEELLEEEEKEEETFVPTKRKSKTQAKSFTVELEEEIEDSFLDCSAELQAEEYLE